VASDVLAGYGRAGAGESGMEKRGRVKLPAKLSQFGLPLCFAALAGMALVNLWQTSRIIAATGPYSPPDGVSLHDRACEPVRQSLLARGVREPVGFVVTDRGERNSQGWTEVYYLTQYAILPVVLDPAYERCHWVVALDEGAQTLLGNEYERVEDFSSGLALWRRRAP
jgi:hypothetical protein